MIFATEMNGAFFDRGEKLLIVFHEDKVLTVKIVELLLIKVDSKRQIIEYLLSWYDQVHTEIIIIAVTY